MKVKVKVKVKVKAWRTLPCIIMRNVTVEEPSWLAGGGEVDRGASVAMITIYTLLRGQPAPRKILEGK